VTCAVPYGQVTGVLGLNGAGKTTLLKIICNLISPDAGQVLVTGEPLPSAGSCVCSRVGYAPNDERSFYWRLNAWQNLKFFASLHGLHGKAALDRIRQLLDTFDLGDVATKRFQEYSSGMRKRLSLVRALLHNPQVLVLDEPTNSLDLGWDHFLRDYVRAWLQDQADRRAVLWSTHRMEEARAVCDNLMILRNGLLAHRWHATKAVTEQELKDAVGLGPATTGEE
jgi:ABC-type multidrug transport system ATPase subunit